MGATLKKLSWVPLSVLGWNLVVILWGAYVRMSGSGAGCGSHWPSCQGEIVPRAPALATIIEFTHRVSSGMSVVLALAALTWALYRFPHAHKARRAAVAGVVFVFLEALVGAGIVLFGLTAKNDSAARAVVIAIHLLNTLGLIASYTLLWLWSGEDRPLHRPRHAPLLIVAMAAVLVTSATGAVTALGDTLFPVNTDQPVAARVGAELGPAMHFLVRLRIVHPLIAVSSALLLLIAGAWFIDRARRPALALMILVVAQVCAGLLNIALAAPEAMQLLHLFLANAVWIALVTVAARVSAAR